ncbi:unnamed protein product, partial [marine sediment metagenome]
NPVKIGVDASTRDVLRGLKKGGETFDDVVRHLIKYWVLEESYEGADRILDLLDMEEEVSV